MMEYKETQEYICPQTRGRERESGCIGALCAAWRWSEPKWGDVCMRKGYCGLAGEAKYPKNQDQE